MIGGSMKIIIVGLGLIGGGIAKALKKSTAHEIMGIDTDESTLEMAADTGAIDGIASAEDIAEADLIYLCVYPQACLSFMKENLYSIKQSCIITDCCGIKREIVSGIKDLQKERSFVFIPAHPMAGKEKNGFAESDPAIFQGASYIIATEEESAAAETLSELAKKMGFGRIVRTTPEKHDRIIAFTSQLPHVLACAYVLSPQSRLHSGFSAGSYRDVSRVADINAELWTDLFLDNADDLLAEIDTLIENLSKIRKDIAEPDREKVFGFLSKAAEIKRAIDN